MRNLGLLGLALAAACVNSGGNTAAMVQVIAPAQNQTIVQGFGVDVRIDADDPDDQAVVRIKMDVDGDPGTTGDQTLLATLLEQDGAELDYVWQTGGVPPGDYYLVYQILETGRQPVEMPGAKITILTRPTLSVGQGNRTIIAGTDVTVAFNATDPDGVASYAIYADRDCNFSTTGDQITIASGLTAQQNSAVWMTAGVAIADYCIFITMSDGMNPLTVRQAGTIELHSDLDLIFAPMPTPPLVPDAAIVTLDPLSPDWFQIIVDDGLGDVPLIETDITLFYMAQQNGFVWLGLELYNPFDDPVIRPFMEYYIVFEHVTWNNMTGTFALEVIGGSLFAYFDEDPGGSGFSDVINVPFDAFYDDSLTFYGYLEFRIPDSAFAFPIFTNDRSDFEVFAVAYNDFWPEIDVTDTKVVRFRNDN